MSGEFGFFQVALEGIFGSQYLVALFIILVISIILLFFEVPKSIILGIDFTTYGVLIFYGIPAWIWVLLGIIIAVFLVKVFFDVFYSR